MIDYTPGDVTLWFTKDIKPVRVGVYEVYDELVNYSVFQHWDGKFWGLVDITPKRAQTWEAIYSVHQNLPWRGFIKETK